MAEKYRFSRVQQRPALASWFGGSQVGSSQSNGTSNSLIQCSFGAELRKSGPDRKTDPDTSAFGDAVMGVRAALRPYF